MMKLMSPFLGLIIFLNFTPSVLPQQAEPKQELPFPGALMKREPEGNYLGPLAALRRCEADYAASDQWRGIFYDMMSYTQSFVGDYAEAIKYFDKGQDKEPLKEAGDSTLDRYSPKSALTVIGSVADKEQVIMVNEGHHVPMHRAFTTRLLPILYAKGFRYLAVEGVSESDAQLNERGYPVYRTGLYPSEPVFGDMLRVALKLGFKIVPYEYQGKCRSKPDNPYFCQNERERGQAQNIYDRILREHPDAKILVHAGAGHIQEYRSRDVTIMAAHFKEISKIDPFTVDQLEMMEHSAPEYEEPDYRYATRKGLIKEPTIFVSGGGDFWKNNGGQFGTVDAQVFHPRVSYRNARPLWLQLKGLRRPYAVDKGLMKRGSNNVLPSSAGMFLVQAFFAEEAEGAVPVDQVVVFESKQKPVLMLRVGVYRIRVIDASGKVRNEFKVVRR
jgi:hypothetical protein